MNLLELALFLSNSGHYGNAALFKINSHKEKNMKDKYQVSIKKELQTEYEKYWTTGHRWPFIVEVSENEDPHEVAWGKAWPRAIGDRSEDFNPVPHFTGDWIDVTNVTEMPM